MALTGKIMDFFADKAMTIPAFPRTKVKAVSDDNGIGLNALLDGKQERHIVATATLTSSGWTDKQQTVNVSVVGTDSTVIVVSAPQNFDTYAAAGVYCSGQSEGQLTFTCSSVPKVALTANILILN